MGFLSAPKLPAPIPPPIPPTVASAAPQEAAAKTAAAAAAAGGGGASGTQLTGPEGAVAPTLAEKKLNLGA